VPSNIEVIIGLGNPGHQYQATRHNAGFWFVDALAQQHGGHFKPDNKFHAEVCKLTINAHPITLLKPNTFMNRSGQAASTFTHFYKIPMDKVLVAHDELDFPAGKIRLKQGGGHGGHNGLRDIIGLTGNKDFYRLRIGIDHPGHREQVTGHVLSKPAPDELTQIEQSIIHALDITPLLAQGDLQKAMHRLHNTPKS